METSLTVQKFTRTGLTVVSISNQGNIPFSFTSILIFFCMYFILQIFIYIMSLCTCLQFNEERCDLYFKGGNILVGIFCTSGGTEKM